MILQATGEPIRRPDFSARRLLSSFRFAHPLP
jgi:hypothetical protein